MSRDTHAAVGGRTSTSKLVSYAERDVEADLFCDSHLEPVRLRKNPS